MKNFISIRFGYWFFCGIVLVAFQACQQAIQQPIDQFQKSTAATVAAIGQYYNELNRYERKLYFQGLALDPQQPMGVTDENRHPTPFLSEPFSATAIQARLALLRQLSTYAERLTALAGNDAPARFRTNTASLANSLTALQGTFNQLSKDTRDADAGRYVGPLSTIAGIMGNVATASKRDKLLRQAVVAGEQPINQLLSFLAEDLDKYVSATRLTGLQEQLSDLSLLYNAQRNNATPQQRQTQLDELAQLADEYRLLQSVQPSDVVRQMKTAHQTLVQAVRTNNPLSVGLVVGVVEEYEAMAGDLLAAVRTLRDLNQPKK